MRKFWTIKELNFLVENYPAKGARFVSEHTGRTIYAVRDKAARIGLKCTNPNANKGRKRTKTITAQQQKNLTEKRLAFYKNRHSWLYRVAKDKFFILYNPKGCLGKQVIYHRWLWEQVYGPIPERHVVRFKDENCFNVTISNLYIEKQEMHVNRIVKKLSPEERKIRNEYKKLCRDINMHNRLGLKAPKKMLDLKEYYQGKHPVISRRKRLLALIKKELII